MGFGVLAGFLLSVLAELGDLVESLLKRYAQVKDSGKVMPGHGGALDRFDSLLFTGAGGLLLRSLYRMIFIQ
jgi:phosphatidate cytidylyltransferase